MVACDGKVPSGGHFGASKTYTFDIEYPPFLTVGPSAWFWCRQVSELTGK